MVLAGSEIDITSWEVGIMSQVASLASYYYYFVIVPNKTIIVTTSTHLLTVGLGYTEWFLEGTEFLPKLLSINMLPYCSRSSFHMVHTRTSTAGILNDAENVCSSNTFVHTQLSKS